MDWFNRHASEILVAVITAILIKLVDHLFAKRSKVFFFFTNAAQFQVGNVPTHTITLALWNSGRAVAEAVRVVHFHLPVHYQVWPPMATVVNVLPSGHSELVIPQILPQQMVFISYLDFIPLTTQIIVQIEAKDHKADLMTFQFTRVFPKWVNYTLQGLILLGVVVAIRYLYLLGVALLKSTH